MAKSILPDDCETKTLPLCDGGEYTFDILQSFYGDSAEVIDVPDVVNPYGKKVTASYLTAGDTAFVVSSEILHLTLDEDEYKNPLRLTDFGLGQLIADAAGKGYKDIRLCLGGTTTIGFGIGTAQALGARIIGQDGNAFSIPVVPEMYSEISRIEFCPEKYTGIRLSVINDGITKASDLGVVNPLKIGSAFAEEKEKILDRIDMACSCIYKLTGLTENDAWSGNAGGIYFGIEKIFDTEYSRGAEYFSALFGLERAVADSDIVVTGEGRFDNPHLKKLPVYIAELAKKHGKKVIFLCGQIAPEWAKKSDILSEGVYRCRELKDVYGIDLVLSCTEFYASHGIVPSADVFREYTPIILKERIATCQTCFH